MIGVVTTHLYELIAKQVEEQMLVVWYDPDRAYAEAAPGLDLANTTVAGFDGSFLQLRHEIDRLLDGEEPPRLVVYVPEDQSKTNHALVELEAAGVVIQPGQRPAQRNTRLSIIARNALKGVLGEGIASDVEKQVEAGKLTLADVNALAGKGDEISSGVVSLIFGSGNPQTVALSFLGGDRFDREIEEKSANGELSQLLGASFETEFASDCALSELRSRLGRLVLLTELVQGLGEALPSSLGSVKVASAAGAIDSCIRLAKLWRQLRDYRDSYVQEALRLEQDFRLAEQKFRAEDIMELETCLALEKALLRHVEGQLLVSADRQSLELSRSHLSRFWASVMPSIQAHWALISAATEVLLEADRVESELKASRGTVSDLVAGYAEGEAPWCLLDTHHRHMESRWYSFEVASEHESVERVVVKARQRYVEVGSELARRFVKQWGKSKHPLEGRLLYQRDIFSTFITPALPEQKIAYVWVDALRFEMARELCEGLRDTFGIDLRPAAATMPTITEVGMAFLLPNAATGQVVSTGGGKLAVDIGGEIIKDRKDRIGFLGRSIDSTLFEAKLDDLLPKPSKRVKQGIKNANLVLITSQEIDELCERDNVGQARRQMDGVLSDLGRGLRNLAKLGIETIVVTADHGHLFAEEISDDLKINAPGGGTADLHRRVWVGVGGTSEPSYLRASLSSLGVPSEFDLATPYSFAFFKAKGGGRAYFHGGMSPQELIIPVMALTPVNSGVEAPPTGVMWELKTGSPKVTTRFFSVQVAGEDSGQNLFGFDPPRVLLELRARRKCVSRPVSASYGFDEGTGEVQLRLNADDPKSIEPNTVALMLVEELAQKSVTLVLLDASSGAELTEPLTVEVDISI